VKESEEITTHIFEKLSHNTENLNLLVEASVGDILEAYFSSCKPLDRPSSNNPAALLTWEKLVFHVNVCEF